MDSSWLIENARLIDPSNGMDRVGRLLILDGRFAGVDTLDGDVPTHVERLDARDCIVAPGLVDLGTEFGEPGREEDETIQSGTLAALAGGYTSVALSSNTLPPIDTAASVEFIHQKASRADHCRVYALGCVSKERKGESLAEIGSLVDAGAVALYDGPNPIENTGLLRRALEYCLMFDRVVFDHPEIASISRGGVMHEGLEQLKLGLAPMPAEAEDLATSRDLRLIEATGGRLHLTSISTSGSVELCRRAKSRGIQFTAGSYVANLHFTDEALRSFDANCKVNPPFRSRDHVEACLEGLADGTIDIISSGHKPCSLEKKMLEINDAPFGMIALETALAEVVTFLIRPGILSWPQALAKMSWNPSKLLGLPGGTLEIGKPADAVIIQPDRLWRVNASNLKSRSYNTPLDGADLYGAVTHTFVGGRLRYHA
ncbi:dihydroorotase [Pirellula sp. SH-Sr6A]|uniref:dihydroorotase n=1 Tax=Pirellula sp. SH-Sr6A TaxID=1632865 RepID=UPI0011BAD1A6|nr:dihydroorotase [Pirellula sp. SH-Sr6A]